MYEIAIWSQHCVLAYISIVHDVLTFSFKDKCDFIRFSLETVTMSCYPPRADSKICWHQDGEDNGREMSENPLDSKRIATSTSQERSIAEISNGSTSKPKAGNIYLSDAHCTGKTEFNKDETTISTSHTQTVTPSTISPTTELLASTPLIDQSVIASPHDFVYMAESECDTESIVDSVLHDPLSPTIPSSVEFPEISLGDVMAFDAYMRGDYSIGQVLPEYLPQPLEIPLKVVVEEDAEAGISELEDTSRSRCCTSEEAKSSSSTADPMGMFNYGYLKQEDWYQSLLPLHQGAKVQNAKLSTGVDVQSLAPSIHDFPSSREKPLPALPPAARELLLRRNTNSSSTIPNSRGATDLSLHSKYSKRLQDCDIPLPRRPVPPLIVTTVLESSSTTSTHPRSRSSTGEKNIPQALVHPAFRQDALGSSKYFATKDDLRNIPMAMTRYGHERIMSNSTQSSMFSPSKPPSSTPSSYLHSPPMSPKHPSIAFSDPLPFRSARGSPLTLLSEFVRSPSEARASLEMTGPNSPYIRRNYRPEPRRSRDGLKEYAEAIEAMHGLVRDGDIDDENEDPLILKKHELLTCGDTPNPSITKINLTAGNNKTWPMKKKSSRLRRVRIVELNNQGSINSSTFSFGPLQQPTDQARPANSTSEYSVIDEPGKKIDLASTTNLMTQPTGLEKIQPPSLARRHPTELDKEIYNLNLSEKEHAAVMKDLQERRGIRARWLSGAMSLGKAKPGSKDMSNSA